MASQLFSKPRGLSGLVLWIRGVGGEIKGLREMFTGGQRGYPCPAIHRCPLHTAFGVACCLRLASTALVHQRRGLLVTSQSFVPITGPGVKPMRFRIVDDGQLGARRGMRISLSHYRTGRAGTSRGGIPPRPTFRWVSHMKRASPYEEFSASH